MSTDDQTATIAFLARPGSHAADAPVEVIETHISVVFLAGARAYKLKRVVRLPYADFSSPEIRLATCEKEVALNAPTAPDLYVGVRRITRGADGGLQFDGPGPLVDAVVEMVRFDQDQLFDRLAETGGLTPRLMTDLTGVIVALHCRAPVIHAGGGAANLAAVLAINAAGFATSRVFGQAQVSALDARFRQALNRHAAQLDQREAAGRVRRCHGDLYLRNICLFRGQPRLFDCIDFNDQIATVDVLYDLAFLLMDLWHRGQPALASLVANRYCDSTGEDAGFALLPFLMAVRAAVRAHVTATFAEGAGGAVAATLARSYFDLARALLGRGAAPVVAIGGLSGSGKSTVAAALAPRLGLPPGARILESDRTRKAMCGVDSDTRLPPAAYSPEMSEVVYARLGARVAAVQGAGAPVIVDAVFDRPDRRAAIAAAVPEAARFAGFWLEAPPDILRARVRARTGGPSDATIDVLEAQLARDHGKTDWHRIDAGGPPETAVAAILATLDRDQPQQGA